MESMLQRTARAWRSDLLVALREFEDTGAVSYRLAEEMELLIERQRLNCIAPNVNRKIADQALLELQHMHRWVLRRLMAGATE